MIPHPLGSPPPSATTAPNEPSTPRRRNRSLLAGLALVCLVAATPLTAAPTLQFTQVLTANGVTPRGTAVVFSIAREPLPWMTRLVPQATTVEDTDGDGVVVYDPGMAFEGPSVWSVVDALSGDYAIGEAAGYVPLSSAANTTSVTAESGFVTVPHRAVEVLVVRPGDAAWHGRFQDGGLGDTGAADDGTVRVDLDSLQRLWHANASSSLLPGALANGDTVITLDPVKFQVFAFEFQAQNEK